MQPTSELEYIASHFAIGGTFVRALPCPQGMVNETYQVIFDQNGLLQNFIIQKLNTNWFIDADKVMNNISRVSNHLTEKFTALGVKDVSQRALTLIKCRDGRLYFRDSLNAVWRCFVYVTKSAVIAHSDDPKVIYRIGRAIGDFHHSLLDLPGPRLDPTIHNLHDTRRYFDELGLAVKNDSVARAESVANEVVWLKNREWMADIIRTYHESGILPERIVHNDAKMTNIMLDPVSEFGNCIIDLDTVMPGHILYDFGNMVRSATISNPHGASNLDSVYMRLDIFDSLTRGYLSIASEFLTNVEIELMVFSGKVTTLNVAIHYLTDHLNGDRLHQPKRINHNLDRYKLHRKLLESIETQQEAMHKTVYKCTGIISGHLNSPH